MRWCPTPEQLMILEEMYRGGLKTPNASRIQKITAHLSLYGRIEGKNVFYWFQNHKARDRQKLRKKLLLSHHEQLIMYQQQLCHQYYHPPNYDHLFHNLLQYSPSSSALAHQVGRVEDSSAKPIMNCKWKVDVEDRIKKMYTNSSFLDNKITWDSDWMMDVGATLPPYCFNRSVPLKTLQLFPITTTTLKKTTSSPN